MWLKEWVRLGRNFGEDIFLLQARFLVQIILFVHCHTEFLSRSAELQLSISTQTSAVTRVRSKLKLFCTDLSADHAYILDYVINCEEYRRQSDLESDTTV